MKAKDKGKTSFECYGCGRTYSEEKYGRLSITSKEYSIDTICRIRLPTRACRCGSTKWRSWRSKNDTDKIDRK